MADVEFSHGMGAYGRDADQQEKSNKSLVTVTNIAGAIVSLALIAGVGVWGYKLMVRDVSGIPVVRAAEGEMRVRPENPGGQLAQHQGLAVNAIAAEGVAAGPVDQVILAPRAITLSEDDQPIAEPITRAPAALEQTVSHEPSGNEDAVAQSEIDALVAELARGTVPMVQVSGAKTVVAPQPVPASDETTTDAVLEDAVPETEHASLATPDVAAAPVIADPSVAVSIRPRLRPNEVPAIVQEASYTPKQATAEVDPDQIPSGTRLAQLGAYESAEVARSEWARLETRFGPYLQDKSRVIQQAKSNGRTFYRLRAMGFVDLSDARRFCAVFKAEGADCIPVQVR